MESELYTFDFISGWGDFHVIKVYKNNIVYEIINWGDWDFDFVKPSWASEEYTHHLFYDSNKNDEKLNRLLSFL